jgi:hypothetical protein
MASGLVPQFKARLKRLAKDKHSNLLEPAFLNHLLCAPFLGWL